MIVQVAAMLVAKALHDRSMRFLVLLGRHAKAFEHFPQSFDVSIQLSNPGAEAEEICAQFLIVH